MTDNLNDYVTVREAARLIKRNKSLVYRYLYKNLIDGAQHFAGTRWLIPRKWCDDFNDGKIDISGAFSGIYEQYRKKKK